MVKKISKIIIFIRFGTIHERDGQIHRQTPHYDIGRAYALHCAAKSYNVQLATIIYDGGRNVAVRRIFG